MADYHTITAIGRAILSLLENACPRDEFEKAEFMLYKSDNFKKPLAEGVSLYLYRVGTSSRRNLPPRRDQFRNPRRPPLPLDLYYILTAWAESADKQQYLLGWSLRELNDNPILPASLLNHYFKSQRGNGICRKNSLTIQGVVASASSSLLWNVAKIFFATDPLDGLRDGSATRTRPYDAFGAS